MIRGKFLRTVSVFLALNLLIEIISPSVALALTGGPAQPELSSFEPIGTTDMVNLFSGDFVYNIPLLTVPGPNGGYPINLAYHAGIGMEQEASWTGLGWNVNVGAINRMMRGLPDDFNGENIKKTYYTKPNSTIGISFGSPTVELFNFDAAKGFGVQFDLSLYYNTYKGMGVKAGLDATAPLFSSMKGNLNASFDSQSGLGLTPSLSFSKQINDGNSRFSAGGALSATFHSRQGFSDLSFRATADLEKTVEKKAVGKDGKAYKDKKGNVKEKVKKDLNYSPAGASVSFSASSTMPYSTIATSGTNASLSFKPGAAGLGIFGKLKVGANFSSSWVKTKTKSYKSYGYMYMENASDEDLKDFNREKDVPVSKDVPFLAMPSLTYDIYNVQGQGAGGVFRPYRSDVGVLSDPPSLSTTAGGDVTVEIGAATDIKFGGDVSGVYGETYSGIWRNMPSDFQNVYGFQSNPDNEWFTPLYEPYYMKASGEQTATELNEFDYLGGDEPKRFQMSMLMGDVSWQPKLGLNIEDLTSYTAEGPTPASITRKEREKRVQNMVMRKIEELGGASAQTRGTHILSLDTLAKTDMPEAIATAYDHANRNHQVGEIESINPDGSKYIYGIPVYNNLQKDVMFAIDSKGGSDPQRTTYSSGQARVNNNQGMDEFFSSTEIGPYAHSYLLTEVLSADYIDLTGDGPTDDDFGGWVKFYYGKISDYKWRSPYQNANYIAGYLSNTDDDKASYTYGEKDIYYLKAIETKSHVAEFSLKNRSDAKGVSTEHQNSGSSKGKSLKYLKAIHLFSKDDPNYATAPTPIKIVHFDYSYDLCDGAENSDNSGKLTLKRVWFEFGKNKRGVTSPYKFTYAAKNTDQNPDYSNLSVDRWGNYKPVANNQAAFTNNAQNPYVNQYDDYDGSGTINTTDTEKRNKNASAWCLTNITLPSGGEIEVDYESDDYAYVQDKKAMQMLEVAGFGSVGGTDLQGGNTKVYFKLDTPLPSSLSASAKKARIKEYIQGIDKLYYKTYLKLKNKPGAGSAYDYIDGFAEVKQESSSYGVHNDNIGYFSLKPVKVHSNATSEVNPITKAGWQNIRLYRSDLFDRPNNAFGQAMSVVFSVLSFLESLAQLITGYYNYSNIRNYCKTVSLSSSYPSLVRLNVTDGVKYGGGHRVRRIELHDKWNTMSTTEDAYTYGQEYSYRLPDGSSSGVASYEPLIGGEENPLRQPIRYSRDALLTNDKALYIEKPIGESFYPSASVGYSRVVVRSITDSDEPAVNEGGAGITVNEYYTAKDFPVIARNTPINNDANSVSTFFVPFVGGTSFENVGYSQGYSIELNNMHGMMKSEAVYAHGADLNSPATQPTSKTEYHYHTEAPYSPNVRNRVKSEVTVLYGENVYRQANLGKTMDFYVDLRENHSYTATVGAQIDVHTFYVPPFIFIPFVSVIPSGNYYESTYSTVVTNKIVNKTGILKKIVTLTDGITTEVENLMYSAETGQPLLTRFTNAYAEPVYDYEMPAYWYYEAMRGSYRNIGAKLSFASGDYSFSSGTLTISASGRNMYEYFTPGDHISLNGQDCWVEEVGRDYITPKTATNTAPSVSGTVTIVIKNSGYDNQQKVPGSKLLAISNPVTTRVDPVFDKYNTDVEFNNITTDPHSISVQSNSTCGNDISWSVTFYKNTANFPAGFPTNIPNIMAANGTCTDCPNGANGGKTIKFYIELPKDHTMGSLGDYIFNRTGSELVAIKGGTEYLTCRIVYLSSTDYHLPEGCLSGVLDANVVEYSDDKFTYNYADVYDDNGNEPTIGSTPISDPSDLLNDYRYGSKGIMRTYRSRKYLTFKNPQLVSGISFDLQVSGYYNDFQFNDFEYEDGLDKWKEVSRVTQYNPYGFEVENEDALGIKSSALYAYDNALATAVASNAANDEIGFESFEEKSGSMPNTTLNVGRLYFTRQGQGTASFTTTTAHTGFTSFQCNDDDLRITFPSPALNLSTTKKYVVRVWVKGTDDVTFSPGGATVTKLTDNIDGWSLFEAVFTPSAGSELIITKDVSTFYIDDLRIQPFNSSMRAFVYNIYNWRLMAELDDQNLSTFYNYSEEGKLSQVKKETDRGIYTIQHTREYLSE